MGRGGEQGVEYVYKSVMITAFKLSLHLNMVPDSLWFGSGILEWRRYFDE
jgi:hypothetical protein